MADFKSIKIQLIIFLACFAAYSYLIDKQSAFIFTLCLSVAAASGTESLLLYFRSKKFQVTQSSLISGLIVGTVLSADNRWWVIVLAAVFAIASKHLLRINSKHVFNPAAFGIFLSIILLGAFTQWRGVYLWYILVPFGIYFVYKIQKLEILAGFVLVFFVLFGIQVFIRKGPIWNILGYLNYFYLFIMLIEPKTTPSKQVGKVIFGAGTAVFIFVLTEMGVRFDVELCSLLILNALTPMLNHIPQRRIA
ncbi:MAG: RnfABCDGE type electron transport complex subunit D [Candidatus Omnitrophica bacterium]|nr:RnfABCDGE type electron transport complex subunit D [Candidatus Omnitrophota bacterium]